MKKQPGTLKICSRGHKFYKSSDCPVCPICWSGFYRKGLRGDFPDKLGAPALRGLLNANIKNLNQLSQRTAEEVKEIHGVGPNAFAKLKAALRAKKLHFADHLR
jgi:hypothetical protein